MKVEEIIDKDKVREVRENFYNGIMEKMARNKRDGGPVICKRHLGVSIAAGIAIGILVGCIHHRTYKLDRQVAMLEWLGKYNVNEIRLECIEERFFN